MRNYLKSGVVECPTCGRDLEETDCIDIEVDVSCVRLFKVGICSYCGKNYQWCEVFTYEDCTTPEEIGAEDEED